MNKVEHAIDECAEHLKTTDSYGTEIEAYLTRYLIILTSAYFEELLEDAFIARAKKTNDNFIISYFENDIPNKLKSVGISKLSEFIKKFGEPYVARFYDQITKALSKEVTSYGNIIKSRHLVAHETTAPQMTFREFVCAYHDSQKVINTIASILL